MCAGNHSLVWGHIYSRTLASEQGEARGNSGVLHVRASCAQSEFSFFTWNLGILINQRPLTTISSCLSPLRHSSFHSKQQILLRRALSLYSCPETPANSSDSGAFSIWRSWPPRRWLALLWPASGQGGSGAGGKCQRRMLMGVLNTDEGGGTCAYKAC